MKNIKQLFVCLLAISMTISVSAHAIATDAMESAISVSYTHLTLPTKRIV